MSSARASLEALATSLESMERDTRIISHEFLRASHTSRAFLSSLRTSASPDSSSEVPFSVMLASQSKWRRTVLEGFLPRIFELTERTLVPDIDEKAVRDQDPKRMVVMIANAKADKVMRMLGEESKPDFVICADQVVLYADQVREKPLTKLQASTHLQDYGKNRIPARCVTGVVVVCVENGTRFEGVDEALQYFKPIPANVVNALLAKGDIMHSAGSFTVEDPIIAPFLGERSGEVESIQGMPKALTKKLLKQASEHMVKRQRQAKRLKQTEASADAV